MEQACQTAVAAPVVDEADPGTDLFCAKCSEMVDYFIGECQTLGPRVTKLLGANEKLRKKYGALKEKSQLMDFDYEEMKAQKEEAEERFSNLLKLVAERKSDTTAEQETEPAFAHVRVEEVLLKVSSLEQERLNHLDSIKAMQSELQDKSAKFGQLEKESAQLRELNTLLVEQVKAGRQKADELGAKNQELGEALSKLTSELEASKQQQACVAVDLIDFDEVQTKTTTTITHNEVKVVGEAVLNDLVSEVKEVTVDERHLKIGHVTMETTATGTGADKELADRVDEIRRLTDTLDSYETQFRQLNEHNLAEISRLKQSEAELSEKVKALEQENKCLLDGLQFSEETISTFTSRQSELEKTNREQLAKIAELSANQAASGQALTTRVQELERMNAELTMSSGQTLDVMVQAFEERCWTDRSVQLDNDGLDAAEIAQLKLTVSDLERQLGAQLAQNQELKLTIEGRTMEVNECLASVKNAQDKLEASKREKEQLTITIDELQQKVAESNDQVARLTEELKSVSEKATEYELKVQALTDQLSEMVKQAASGQESTPVVKPMEDEPMDQGETVAPAEVSTPPEPQEAETDRLKDALTTAEAQLSALQLKMDEAGKEHEAKVKALEDEIGQLKASLEAVREEKRVVEETLTSELTTKSETESELELVRAELASLRDQLDWQAREHEAVVSELKASLTTLQEQSGQLASTVDEANKKLQNAEEQARGLADENKCLADKYDESEATVSKLILRLNDMEQVTNERMKKLTDELASLERAKAGELLAKQQELEEKIEEVNRLTTRLAVSLDQTGNGSRLSFSCSQLTGKLQLDDESMDVEMNSPSSPSSTGGSSPAAKASVDHKIPEPASPAQINEPEPELVKALKVQNEALEGQLKQAQLDKSERTQKIIELTAKVAALVKLDSQVARDDLQAFGQDEEPIKATLVQFGESLRDQFQEMEQLSQATIGELRAKCEEMSRTFAADLDAKKAEIDVLTDKIAEIETRTGEMLSELSQAKASSEAGLNEKIAELSRQIEQVTGEKEQEIGRLSEMVSKLTEDASGQAKWSSEQLSSKAEENDQLKAALEARTAEVKECLTTLANVQQELEAIKQEREQLTAQVDGLTSELTTRASEIQSLTSELTTRASEIQSLTSQLTQADQLRQAASDTLTSQEALIEGQRHELVSKQKELDTLQYKLSSIESQLSQTSREVSDEMSRLKELYASSLHQQDELKALNAKTSEEAEQQRTALEASQQENGRLVSSLEATGQRLAQAQLEVEALESDKAELESKIRQIDADTKCFIETTTSSMSHKTARIEALEAELEAARCAGEAERSRADAELKKVLEDVQVLGRVNEQLEARLAEVRDRLARYEEIKTLELATMRQEYESAEVRLSAELAELRSRHEHAERVKAGLESALRETQADLSSVRAQMIEYESELNSRQAELRSRVEQEKEEYIKRACKFERLYLEENEQNTVLQKKVESLKAKMEERERELEDAHLRKLEAKSAEIGLLEQRLYSLSKQYELQLTEAAELNAQWMLKLSEEGKKIKDVYDQHKAAELKLSEAEHANQRLSAELSSARSLLAEVERKVEAMQAEKAATLSGQEALGQDLVDLQRKLCQALSDKEDLFKDIIKMKKQHEESRKEYLDAKAALEHQVTTLERQLAQAQQQQSRSSSSSYSNMNESLMLKIDRHIDSNIQAKLDDLMEQRHRHLMEIERAKKELDQLKAKLASEVERLAKEHQKALKDKQHQHEKAVNKHLSEIKKLQETNKEMQETNDYLAKTIDNLNKQIYEMSEKENESATATMANSSAASMSMSLFASASKSKTTGGKKPYDDSTFSTPGKPVNKHLLTARDINKTGNNSLLEPGSPSNQSDSMPKTPSSTIKKQNQCAQQ